MKIKELREMAEAEPNQNRELLLLLKSFSRDAVDWLEVDAFWKLVTLRNKN